MEALLVEGPKRLAIREIDLPQDLGPHDVRIAMNNVGICGSDLNYYKQVNTVRRWQKYTLTETYTGVTDSGFVIFYYASKRPGNLAIDDVELTVRDPE